MKKGLAFIFTAILLVSAINAQIYNLEISTIPSDKIFNPGETIQLKTSIYDSENNLIQDSISIILKNLQEEIVKEETIPSNIFGQITLPENMLAGEGQITAKYQDTEITESITIRKNKKVDIKIEDNELILTNIGNTIYDNGIYIIIGDTTGAKTPKLNIGESISYKLVAPEGNYNIKVTDENKNTLFSKGGVGLSGTGQVIAAVDNNPSGGVGLTGGISPDEGDEEALLSYAKNSKFIYVFILTIFGAMILLAIERRYKKKAK